MEKTYVLINKLANMQRRYFDSLTYAGKYSGAQGKVLDYLFHHEGSDVFQRDLEHEFGMRPPTATALLKSMAEAGLISRTQMADDARYKRIIPTDKAKTLEREITESTAALETKLKAGIDQSDLETWEKVVHKMMKNLEA